MIGKTIQLRFPVEGEIRVSVADHDSDSWRKLNDVERSGPLSDAVDAFILALIEGGELQRVHTQGDEQPYWVT